ncbi:dITP/XTP pyrophosphatase [Candidatus Calditenuaceae archaeon HR02]|nr:dITP/XTP pyrophosphatase [Candidatus Calditenuaceae archaeon HR02]
MISVVKVVTTNPGKWAELSAMLSSHGIECVWIRGKAREIQSDDLAEIVKSSALEAFDKWGENVLVEDSGLFVRVLRGFPGPYSSYVYRTIGLAGLLKLLEGVSDRVALFRSALCFVAEGGRQLVFTGEVRGVIAVEPRGTGGFGFDPIFIPEEGDGRTFAEMTISEKNLYSHRSRALKGLLAHIGAK